MRPVFVVSTMPLAHVGVFAAVLGLPAPTRSASKKVIGGDRVHQGETRRITVVGDGLDFATSVVSSDARIGVRLLSKKGLAQGRANKHDIRGVAEFSCHCVRC
jgi:fructan beta-fructosidase